MSEFHVEVVRIGEVQKHPNADTLSITKIHGGYPVLFRTGEYKEGDLAIYVPVDALMPEGNPAWEFLRPHWRIKAKRLRGIFSQGLLLPLSVLGESAWMYSEGENVQKELGIVKYEPDLHLYMSGDAIPSPSWFFQYTDLEAYKRHKDALVPGEPVIMMEKIHGANARYANNHDGLWVGSRTQAKAEGNSIWWSVAKQLGFREKLPCGYIFYGEVYGDGVQDLKYNLKGKLGFRVFDIFDLNAGRYMDYAQTLKMCNDLALEMVPALYNGPWSEDLLAMAEGKSLLAPDQVREGFVVRPTTERHDHSVGRVVLKVVGEGYLLRKGA